MADYSVKARLSAVDSGFTSTLRNATKSLDGLGSKLKTGLGLGILQGAGIAAFSSLKNGVASVVGELNSSTAAWKTFAGNMEILGKGKSEIDGVKKELQSFAEQTIYSSSDMASTYAQLAAVGTKNTTQLVKGFGGLAAASENPQQAMKTLSQQATQLAAKPSVAWQDFKLMLEQTPAGIAAVAKEMGMTATELVANVQKGTVSTEEFFAAIAKVGTSDSFSKLATEYKTAGQAIEGLKETVGNKCAPAFDVLSKVATKGISKIIDAVGKVDGEAIAAKVSNWIKKATPMWNSFKNAVSKVWAVVSGVAKKLQPIFEQLKSKIGSSIQGILDKIGAIDVDSAVSKITTGIMKAKPYFDVFAQIVGWIKDAIVAALPYIAKIGNFLLDNSGTISKCIPYILGLVGAFKGFNIIKSLVPGLSSFAGSLVKMAGKGIAGLAGKLFGVAGGEKAAGEAAKTSAKDMLAMGAATLMIGASVLLISIGFALLAQSAIALAAAGWPAVAVMAGLAIAVVALMIGMLAFTKTLAPMAPQMMQVAVAFIALGAAVLLISLGFALLSQSAIALAAAGWPAIAVMVGLIAVIALLAIGAAALAPALTAGAMGLLAFGAGLLLIGVAAILAATAMVILSTCLPVLVQYGLQASVSILALGGALLVFGAAALLVAAGMLVLMAAATVTGVAVMLFGTFAMVAAVGILLMAAALKTTQKSMSSIAKNATKAKKALDSMEDSVSIVEAGLKGLGKLAESAMDGVANAFKGAASDARSAGQEVAQGFTNGMQIIVVMAPAVAMMAVAATNAALMSGQSGAYQSGAYISIGFANGMLSMLGRVKSAANKIVAQANRAIEAKAKIGSPSKITTQYGEWYGEGYANGISGMARDVWKAAENLVSIPNVATPDLAMAYGGELSSEYAYYRNADYRIEVPLTVDGKEFARATAHYNEAELNRRNLRDSRKHGIA